ncbi:sulfate adenylyltransferase subunit CysD [Aquibium oceanicum]|uniref:Sulfate adenylyltransferase subunit 2 n=1 Tax=Aquibium oceanicum TaxID=1670800 RepID=A0A1L3SXU4_9HYPH|nr:sulfate adenylyltransferase subunit CysD [Aquibium oceanicum]APH74164.1 sulfate adenylyltransferase small subunit [Aquibium oceanicum]
MSFTHLSHRESEAIGIIREAVVESSNAVVLFSGGKDSTVLAHLTVKAFYPAKPPIPLLLVDSTWEFNDVIAFRDAFAAANEFELRTHVNEEGRREGLNPIDHGATYTTMMRTDALKQALDLGGYDVILGGARRDEEASRAKERIVSVRGKEHSWDPKNQRPELWSIYNFRRSPEQTLRVYPLSNWTEQDLWAYIFFNRIELCPLYFAAPRPVVEHNGNLIVVDQPEQAKRFQFGPIRTMGVRFRSLGCWPVTAAAKSSASDLGAVLQETFSARISERNGRVGDGSSLEAQKREGYF